MVIRENAFLEASKCLNESRNRRALEEAERIQEKTDERNQFMDNYYNIRESREVNDRRHSKLLEDARNNALSTALKSIYITALEANTLTDNGIILAENMVDSWINEKGGALKIFSECRNNTYLLSRLHQIVEDAAEEEVKEIEKTEEVDTSSKDDSKDDNKESKEDDKNSEDKNNNESDKETEDDNEKEVSADNPLNITDIEDNDENNAKETPSDNDPSDDETDAAEDIIDDIEVDDTPVSIDGDGEENKGKVFDELEKEEDVRKAIELIRQRVADAEEAFIKRNAEDKKQIDELLAKISDNVKTVEDLSDDDSDESKIAQESARLNKQKIKNITENRPLTVLEKMTRNLSSGIIKDQNLREQYVTENGELDTFLVIESAKVMYGFLETISTLQLEKVDSAYITKVLSEM